MADRIKAKDRVAVAGRIGTVVGEDIDNNWSPRIPGEKVWRIRFDDGTSGGGWRTGELKRL